MDTARIVVLYSWLPAILLVVIFLILKFCYHYDKEAGVVMEELARRKKEGTN